MPLLTEIPRPEWTKEMKEYDNAISVLGKTDFPFPKGVYGYIEWDEPGWQYYVTYFIIP